jgi:hypothetical protein
MIAGPCSQSRQELVQFITRAVKRIAVDLYQASVTCDTTLLWVSRYKGTDANATPETTIETQMLLSQLRAFCFPV